MTLALNAFLSFPLVCLSPALSGPMGRRPILRSGPIIIKLKGTLDQFPMNHLLQNMILVDPFKEVLWS